MDKKFTSRDIASIKRIAQNVAPLVEKKAKLAKKIEELNAEIALTQAQIDAQESYVVTTTGYHTEDLIDRQVLPSFNEDGTPKLDKDGRQIKVTKYVAKDVLVLGEDGKYSIVMPEAMGDAVIDENAVVDEVETPAAEAPFDPTAL